MLKALLLNVLQCYNGLLEIQKKLWLKNSGLSCRFVFPERQSENKGEKLAIAQIMNGTALPLPTNGSVFKTKQSIVI
jgi:hypothetical protein